MNFYLFEHIYTPLCCPYPGVFGKFILLKTSCIYIYIFFLSSNKNKSVIIFIFLQILKWHASYWPTCLLRLKKYIAHLLQLKEWMSNSRCLIGRVSSNNNILKFCEMNQNNVKLKNKLWFPPPHILLESCFLLKRKHDSRSTQSTKHCNSLSCSRQLFINQSHKILKVC